MKLTLTEPKYLKDSISIISELVNDVVIKVQKDKLEIVAMDPATVAMIVFRLLSSAFSEYNVKEEKLISISLENLKQVLKRAKPSDIIILTLDEDKNRLVIQLKGESTRTFNISLIDIKEKEQKIPELKFPLKIELNTMIFDEAVEDMDIVSDSVLLLAEQGKLVIQAESNLSQGHVEIKSGDDSSIKVDNKEKVKAKYSIEYLKKMIKGSKIADKVTIQFNKDYPLKLEYKVIDKMELLFILAPRVENY